MRSLAREHESKCVITGPRCEAASRFDCIRLGAAARYLQSNVGSVPTLKLIASTGVRLVNMADSTGQRNGFAEHFSRRLEAKCLAWPLIQLSRYGVELELEL